MSIEAKIAVYVRVLLVAFAHLQSNSAANVDNGGGRLFEWERNIDRGNVLGVAPCRVRMTDSKEAVQWCSAVAMPLLLVAVAGGGCKKVAEMAVGELGHTFALNGTDLVTHTSYWLIALTKLLKLPTRPSRTRRCP